MRAPFTGPRGVPLTGAEMTVLEQIRVANPHDLQAAEFAAEIDYEGSISSLESAKTKHVGRERAVAGAVANFREARDRLIEARQVRRINENRVGHSIVIENGVG